MIILVISIDMTTFILKVYKRTAKKWVVQTGCSELWKILQTRTAMSLLTKLSLTILLYTELFLSNA